MPLNPGQILKERYRIVKALARGGFGTVYKAWDIILNAPCAVKESLNATPDDQRQFLIEAQILARLRHPNLPRVSDFFDIPGAGQYLVMDYVEGDDLEELRQQAGGRLPEAKVLDYVRQVCDALGYLHRQRPAIIHRDIKPANIKITPPDEDYPQGRAMLVDFGISKVMYSQGITITGARGVTPGYSPIEQYGHGSTDTRSDIYALGATLYTLLTGQEPPESPLRAGRDPLIPPRQLNPAISAEVEAAILKAMQMDAERRFQAPIQLKQAVGETSINITSPPIETIHWLATPPTQVVPVPRRAFPGLKLGFIGLGIMMLIGLVATFTWLGVRLVIIVPLTKTAQASDSTTEAVVVVRSTDTITPTPFSGSSTPTITQAPLASPTPSPALATSTPTHTLTPTPTRRLPPTATLTIVIYLTRTPSPTSPPVVPPDETTSPMDGMVLIYIPAGTFRMGSNSGDVEERYEHTVTLDAFWMDRTEVTNAMYARCVAAGECTPPSGTGSYTRTSYYGNPTYDNYPVLAVTWFQASSYCTWAQRQLPTEAQWEYAARGGLSGATYPWGEGIDCSRANYMPDRTCEGDTVAVGSYPANGYGLYDMAGNVWEWVADWFTPSGYSVDTVTNPTGAVSGEYRVIRGGTWDDDASSLRVANRYGVNPQNQNASIGFRCALSP